MALDFTRNSFSKSPVERRGSAVVEGSFKAEKEGSGSSGSLKWFKVEESGLIKSVCILPPRDFTQERKFQLHFRFNSKHDPSRHLSRTGNVEGIELEVEEKDLQPLSRLVGRRIIIHFLTEIGSQKLESLQKENEDLRSQVQNLSRRLRATQDQLQFTVENQIRDSR